MKILDEIRQQPEHIRHVFMWTMVVITFSVIGFVWFRQTTKQFVTLLHPEEAEARALAEGKERTLRQAQGKQLSPFATIFGTLGDLRANISELLAGPNSGLDVNNGQSVHEEQVPPQKLPLSD